MLTMKRTGLQWIRCGCFILILIMTGSGIYPDRAGVNSCFWGRECLDGASAALRSIRNTFSCGDNCAGEQMEESCFLALFDSDFPEGKERTDEALSFLDMLPMRLLINVKTIYGLENVSNRVIINYLHRQDGEKTAVDCEARTFTEEY